MHHHYLNLGLILGVGPPLVYLVAAAIYQLVISPLCKYPGPKLAATSRLPYIYHTLKGDLLFWIQRLHYEYGDVVRIAPDELSYVTGDSWKDIYGHIKQGESSTSKDLRFYGSGIAAASDIVRADDADHSRYRRIFSNAFSDRALREQEALIKTYADKLIATLTHLLSLEATRKIDMAQMYNFTTVDVMGDLTFGENLGLLDGSQHSAWVGKIFSSLKFGAVARLTRYYPFLSGLFNLIMARTAREARRDHIKYCSQRVDIRIKRKEARSDIWGLVLGEENQDQRRLSLEEMYSHSHIFMIAGTETTATLLSGLTYHLLANPSKMDKLAAEIHGAFVKEDDITMSALTNLEYLRACLEEGLRMYPPIPSGLPRIVPTEGKEICGKMVPGKTVVSVQQWAAYRSPKNFKFPNSFIPERWSADSEFSDDKKTCLQPFSFGPRNCLGKNLAYHEMRLILAKVLWHFDLSLCEESFNWSDQKSYTVWEKPPLLIRLTPRNIKREKPR